MRSTGIIYESRIVVSTLSHPMIVCIDESPYSTQLPVQYKREGVQEYCSGQYSNVCRTTDRHKA